VNFEEKTLDNAIEAGILFLLFFTPIAFSTVEFWSESVMEIMVFAIFILWFVKSVISKKFYFSTSNFDIILLLLIAVASFQILPLPAFLLKIFSPSSLSLAQELKADTFSPETLTTISTVPWGTHMEIIKLLTFVMTYFVVVNNFNSIKKIERLIVFLMIIGGGEAIYGLVQYVSGDEMIFNFTSLDHTRGRLIGTFPSPDHFAAYMKMCIFTGLGYLMYISDFGKLSERSRKKKNNIVESLKDYFIDNNGWEGKVSLCIVIILMSTAVIFTKSRSGILSLLISFICFFALVRTKFSSKKMIQLVAVILLFTMLAGIWVGITPVFDRYFNLNVNKEVEEGRFSIWLSTFNIFKDYPVFGSGLGSFVHIYPSYTTRTNQGWVNHAHNDWLELLSDMGIVGFFIVLTGFVLLSTQELFKGFSGSGNRIVFIYFGLYMAIFSMAVHCITDFNLKTTADSFLLSVLTALFILLSKSRELNRKR